MEATYEVFDVDTGIIYGAGLSYEEALASSLAFDDMGIIDTDFRQEPGNTDEYLILI